MEKKLKSELLELCHSIINDEREEDLVTTLTQTQMLYEKLVVLNYLQEQRETEDENDPEKEVDAAPSLKEVSHLSIEKSPQAENPVEEKIEPSAEAPAAKKIEKPIQPISISPEINETPSVPAAGKNRSINEQMATGLLKIGLNDRIAFVKHLFNGEQQDYNRVLSNLNTMSTFEEADSFINQMIKPEYHWERKQEYIDRLMEIIRLKFGEES